MRLTDHAVRFVNICHFLRQQQQLLLGTLGEGKAEGPFELLKQIYHQSKFWGPSGILRDMDGKGGMRELNC